MTFGSTLRELRKKKGVSIKKMAPEVKIDHTYISKIENGYIVPSYEVLSRLAGYFNYDEDEFMLLADKLPDDIKDILKNRPREVLDFLREKFGNK